MFVGVPFCGNLVLVFLELRWVVVFLSFFNFHFLELKGSSLMVLETRDCDFVPC